MQLTPYRAKPRREFGDRQPEFLVRADTSDAKAIGEVFENNSYRRYGMSIEPTDRWVDMGANIGAFSVLVIRCGATLCRAYEADETNAKIARQNILRNGGDPSVVVHGAIVPDDVADNHVMLHTNTEPLSLRRHSIHARRKQSRPVPVAAHRFAVAAQSSGADCVKLNIEGAEIPLLKVVAPGVLRGLRKVVFEWSFDLEPRLSVLRGVVDLLEDCYPIVNLSRKIDWSNDKWDHYPPNVFVYARR